MKTKILTFLIFSITANMSISAQETRLMKYLDYPRVATQNIEKKEEPKTQITEVKSAPIVATAPEKPKTPPKLVYSEDDVYTNLIWKGYRGEGSLEKFKKDNGMEANKKIDEKVLKALGLPVKYK